MTDAKADAKAMEWEEAIKMGKAEYAKELAIYTKKLDELSATVKAEKNALKRKALVLEKPRLNVIHMRQPLNVTDPNYKREDPPQGTPANVAFLKKMLEWKRRVSITDDDGVLGGPFPARDQDDEDQDASLFAAVSSEKLESTKEKDSGSDDDDCEKCNHCMFVMPDGSVCDSCVCDPDDDEHVQGSEARCAKCIKVYCENHGAVCGVCDKNMCHDCGNLDRDGACGTCVAAEVAKDGDSGPKSKKQKTSSAKKEDPKKK